ncbi:MAG TPA: hypothetical protein VM367_03035 [Pseudonocardia sp.]|nr:hypothetical protein [Pseudonocardia sp.]
MRTVCGIARRIQVVLGWGVDPPQAPAPAAALTRRSLLSGKPGEQRRDGVRLDQVDGTTCGSAVLVALAAWADPAELDRLAGPDGTAAPGAAGGARSIDGFGARYDARQREVHRQTNRIWPRALGTTPWSMVRWLRRHAPGAGSYRVRLVDDMSVADVARALDAVTGAVAAGRPVPLLVGTAVPRHYTMALAGDDAAWRVYEPTSGAIRVLDLHLVRAHALRPVLGFDRLHAVLLPT